MPGSDFVIRAIEDGDLAAVSALWEQCALVPPWSSAAEDIRRCRANPSSTILVATKGGHVMATAMVGTDGHRGWVYYVAVQPDARRRGYGRQMVEAAETWLGGRGVPRVLLMVTPENSGAIQLYEAMGYRRSAMAVYGKQLASAASSAVAAKDTLFLLRAGFEEHGARYFCPYSAQLAGMLTYYPQLRETLEVIELGFSKPRRPLSDLLGEAHQAPPMLVLAAEPDAVPDVHVAQANGRYFVAKTSEIMRYLATTRGLPRPH